MSYSPSGKWFLSKRNSATLANTTALQKMFDVTTNGAMILPSGTFLVDWFIAVDNMSGTSGNLRVSIIGAGTASISSPLLHAVGVDGAVDTIATQSGKYVQATVTTGNIVTATTSTSVMVHVTGTIVVITAGTIIPSLGLTTGVGTATVVTSSYCYLQQLSSGISDAVATLGDVS
jgi:hypothetical protein